MRVYFDLRHGQQTLPDLDGVEVTDAAQARRIALEVAREIKQTDASVAQGWSGWTLNVVDAQDVILFSIDLRSDV